SVRRRLRDPTCRPSGRRLPKIAKIAKAARSPDGVRSSPPSAVQAGSCPARKKLTGERQRFKRKGVELNRPAVGIKESAACAARSLTDSVPFLLLPLVSFTVARGFPFGYGSPPPGQHGRWPLLLTAGTMTPLRQRFRHDLQRRNSSPRTLETCLSPVSR